MAQLIENHKSTEPSPQDAALLLSTSHTPLEAVGQRLRELLFAVPQCSFLFRPILVTSSLSIIGQISDTVNFFTRVEAVESQPETY